MSTSPPQQRLHGFDALRAVALFLGVVLHSCMSFMPNSQYFWLVQDPSRNTFSGLLFYVIHIFRMTLFFFLAGFFCHIMLRQKGTLYFIKDRVKRILLPLIVGWPIIFTLFVCAIIYATWIKNNGAIPKTPSASPSFTPDDFPLAHLWFLYLLTLFYVAYVPVYGVLERYGEKIRRSHAFNVTIELLCSLIGPFILSIPVSFALFYTPYWLAWFGIPTPDRSLYPNAAAVIGFGTAFLFGGALSTASERWEHLQKKWPYFACASIVLLIFLWIRSGVIPSLVPTAHGTEKWISAWLYCSTTWTICFFLIGFFSTLFNEFNTYVRYLADASYWVYLIHLPIVIALQALFSKLDMSGYMKLPLIVLTCFSISLLTYRLFVRYTIVGKVLNGVRKR